MDVPYKRHWIYEVQPKALATVQVRFDFSSIAESAYTDLFANMKSAMSNYEKYPQFKSTTSTPSFPEGDIKTLVADAFSSAFVDLKVGFGKSFNDDVEMELISSFSNTNCLGAFELDTDINDWPRDPYQVDGSDKIFLMPRMHWTTRLLAKA